MVIGKMIFSWQFKNIWLFLTAVIFLFLPGCSSALDYEFPYEYMGNVYLCKNGETSEILKKEILNDPGECFNQFMEPCLSPDGTKICCVRFNHYCHSANDSEKIKLELVLLDLKTKELKALVSTDNKEMYEIFSPNWSLDGEKIYYFGDKKIYSFDLQTHQVNELADFPEGQEAHWPGNYLRISLDGKKIYSFLFNPSLLKKEGAKCFVWSIDTATGEKKIIWEGWSHFFLTLNAHNSFPDKNFLPDIGNEDAITALFGSRDFPVNEPQFSNNQICYGYIVEKLGLFAKKWVGVYDTKKKEDRTLNTLYWSLYRE